MGFWIFMLAMVALTPLVMIIGGKLFLKGGPKEINDFSGYRTTMSMKSKDTWRFAHRYCGKLWYIPGFVILILSIIGMFFVIGKDEDTVGYAGIILVLIQCAYLIGTIFPTEAALKKNFDKDGNKKMNGV